MPVIHTAAALLLALLPTRGYFRPGQPVDVRFVTGTSAMDRQVIQAGWPAARMLGRFKDAPAGSVISAQGQPLFHVYTLAGKSLAARPAAGAAPVHGIVNIARFFPEVSATGTYLIVWKSAQPVVLETLNNPGFSPVDLEHVKAQIAALPAAQQKRILLQFQPCVYHLLPLQYARIKTSAGVITLKFWYGEAPRTVANFISLARQRFYDGSNFHRIIKGFMIQGGDSVSNLPGRAGTGGPGYDIVQEFNDRPMDRGVIAMARSNNPDSAGSQFFILQDDTPSLNHQYTGFGRVLKGLKVVDKIANDTPVHGDNGAVAGLKPEIISVKILPATAAMYGVKRKSP